LKGGEGSKGESWNKNMELMGRNERELLGKEREGRAVSVKKGGHRMCKREA
jgi:hypothetical protein